MYITLETLKYSFFCFKYISHSILCVLKIIMNAHVLLRVGAQFRAVFARETFFCDFNCTRLITTFVFTAPSFTTFGSLLDSFERKVLLAIRHSIISDPTGSKISMKFLKFFHENDRLFNRIKKSVLFFLDF